MTAMFAGWILRASKDLYMKKTTFSWIAICEFAQKCLAQELWQYLLTSKTVVSSPEECGECLYGIMFQTEAGFENLEYS